MDLQVSFLEHLPYVDMNCIGQDIHNTVYLLLCVACLAPDTCNRSPSEATSRCGGGPLFNFFGRACVGAGERGGCQVRLGGMWACTTRAHISESQQTTDENVSQCVATNKSSRNPASMAVVCVFTEYVTELTYRQLSVP
jgi:hypothetical protein